MFAGRLLYTLVLLGSIVIQGDAHSVRSSMQAELEKRLAEYEKLNYCSDINQSLDSPLQKLGDEVRETIRNTNESCSRTLEELLPVPTDCNSIIWVVLPYRQLLLGSHHAEKYSNCKLLKSWKFLLPGALDCIHLAIDNVSSHHRALKTAAKGAINEKNLMSLLREFRREALANIANPTAEHVARMVIQQVIQKRTFKNLPKEFVEYVGAIHIFPGEFDPASMQRDLTLFISQQYLRLDVKQKLQFAIDKDWESLLRYVSDLETFCRKGSTQTALSQYLNESEAAPQMIAHVRQLVGDPLFKDLRLEEIPKDVCRDQPSYDACLQELIKAARAYKPTRGRSFKSSVREGNAIPTSCDLVRYDRVKELGKGSFGTVDLYRDMFTGKQVAVKRTLKSDVEKDPEAILLEEKVAKAASHKHLSTIHCSFTADDGDRYWIMPFLSNGDLTKYVGKCTEEEAAEFAAQMLEGVIALHAAGYVHNDIKSENTMFDEDGVLKIIDYGEGEPISYEDVDESPCNTDLNGPGRDLLYVGVTCLSLVFGDGDGVKDPLVYLFGNEARDKLIRNTSEEFKELITNIVDTDPLDIVRGVYLDWEFFKELPIFDGREWDVNEDDIALIQTNIEKILKTKKISSRLQKKDF